ncbi:MAG TPA: UDP-glucose 4-epimerase GalE [Streptosporangiaceae bacterium]|nr:UDP-glucose 4-epimerase GalE [Streptosporangiaceae bacterium]
MTEGSTVLVTGGAGFVGSHTCLELLDRGYEVVVADNYSNSSPRALDRVQKLAGRPLRAYEVDIRDRDSLGEVFDGHSIGAVIHFAGKKAVGESMEIPLTYYDVNVGGTAVLLRSMEAHGVHQLVFSSSCSIYGKNDSRMLGEDMAANPANPYARSKWICEQIMADACARYSELSVVALRYFNPAGAHPTGELGEDPKGVPSNVMPQLAQVAIGRLDEVAIFGSDYPTPDGTCIRDYVHVVDVAEGHCLALEHLADATGMRVFNLGSGKGVSVLGLLAAFGEACGIPLAHRLAERRPGDVACLVADPGRVKAAWGWRATRDLAAMCADAWRFQELNPTGYGI